MREDESFGLSDAEKALFDCVTTEHTNVIGTVVEFFPQQQNNSTVDPLYNEPIKRVFGGPYRLKGFVTYPEHGPVVGQEGFSSTFDCTVFLGRRALELVNAPAPSESDIIKFWGESNYFTNNASVDGFNVPGAGMYFSVVDVKEDSHLFDTPTFQGFTLTLRRNTQQAPERKIQNSL